MHFLLLWLLAIDILGATFGIYAMESRKFDRRFTAVSSGFMLGVALFWIWPDMAHAMGMIPSALSIAVAFTSLYIVDRYVFPVCPCCTHHRCNVHKISAALLPLAIAIGIHNVFDGWVAGIAEHLGPASSSGIVIGLLAHKIPEGVLFGMMLRSASKSLRGALMAAIVTGTAILFGGFVHEWLPTFSAGTFLSISLALACGSFLFVGIHTFLNQRQMFGTRSALVSLLFGIFCTIILEQGAAFLWGA